VFEITVAWSIYTTASKAVAMYKSENAPASAVAEINEATPLMGEEKN
jgi:hypothetical protein